MSIGHREHPSPSPTVSIAAVGDLCAHEVREEDIVLAARGGRYPTLCGQMITGASMAEPTRRRCPRCAELCGGEAAPRSTRLRRWLVGR